MLVCVRNLKRLDSRFSRSVLEGGMKALLQRFATLVGDEAVIGRWDEEHFVAVLNVDPPVAVSIARDAAKRLSGSYSVQENGLAHTVGLQAVTGVIERATGSDGSVFQQKLLQMSDALANA
jgi:hypothetical protein